MNIDDELSKIEKEALTALDNAGDPAQLENLRLLYLGKKGPLTTILSSMAQLDKAERPKVGQKANLVKEKIQARLDELQNRLYKQELNQKLEKDRIDVTL